MEMLTRTASQECIDYVLADYQDNAWYNGPEPAGDVEELAQYWNEYVTDRELSGIPIPEGLTVELYCTIWNALYEMEV